MIKRTSVRQDSSSLTTRVPPISEGGRSGVRVEEGSWDILRPRPIHERVATWHRSSYIHTLLADALRLTVPDMHIKEISLSALRGIHFHVHPSTSLFGSDANYLDMPRAEIRQLNLFAGPNGSGKSTFLDVVRALSDASVLLSLRRSTLLADGAYYSFRVKRSDDYIINVEYKANGNVEMRLLRPGWSEYIDHEAYPYMASESWAGQGGQEAQSFFDLCKVDVLYWRSPDDAVLDADFYTQLRTLVDLLPGVKELNQAVNGNFPSADAAVVFIDEPSISQRVPANDIPSGWRASAGLLSWLSHAKVGSVCVIEEPETHLHPTLQRRVIAEISRIATERKLQLFISTHSSVFITTTNWGDLSQQEQLAVFHVDGRSVTALKAHGQKSALLDALGLAAGDLLQANSIIWVEGPSDRIYIRSWLEAWCDHQGVAPPTENLHYAFCFYGGTVLAHFDGADPAEVANMVSIFSINRHSFVVMDRDDDFVFTHAVGATMRVKSGDRAKYRILDDLKTFTWVTDGYTIESYLPELYFKEGYVSVGLRGKVGVAKLSKSALAEKYRSDSKDATLRARFGTRAAPPLNHIDRLHRFILRANPSL